jgi:hypothetical protein
MSGGRGHNRGSFPGRSALPGVPLPPNSLDATDIGIGQGPGQLTPADFARIKAGVMPMRVKPNAKGQTPRPFMYAGQLLSPTAWVVFQKLVDLVSSAPNYDVYMAAAIAYQQASLAANNNMGFTDILGSVALVAGAAFGVTALAGALSTTAAAATQTPTVVATAQTVAPTASIVDQPAILPDLTNTALNGGDIVGQAVSYATGAAPASTGLLTDQVTAGVIGSSTAMDSTIAQAINSLPDPFTSTASSAPSASTVANGGTSVLDQATQVAGTVSKVATVATTANALLSGAQQKKPDAVVQQAAPVKSSSPLVLILLGLGYALLH